MSLEARRLTVGGARRNFWLAEPDGTASAIVLGLHGTRSSAPRQARLSAMASLAREGSAVVAFPEAIVPIGSGFEWDPEIDTAFLLELVDQLSDRHSPPGGRACMTGMSGGARMACHFAWHHAERVSMVGAVAGLRAGTGSGPSQPVPVLAFHGTADRINPYGGGGTPRWDESVPDAARRWALANGLGDAPSETSVSKTLTRTTYGVEGGQGEVTLWTAQGAGHTWPGARLGLLLRLFLGRTTMEIDATERIWSFAQGHT